jgi:pimeloyl-ACP methyl ester carboxylesterase
MTGLLVLHDVGDPDGGARWRTALASAGWPGAVHAPDLPGHGTTPAPAGGTYELTDALLAVLPLVPADGDLPVVVGVGVNGWCGSVLALGGRAAALVLVDGLGGPFTSPREAMAADRVRLRAIVDDPAAVGPAPPSGLDPRAAHGVLPLSNRTVAERAAAATPVPVLLVETPGSPVGEEDRAAVASRYPAGVTVAELSTADPEVVGPAVVAWAATDRS